MKKLEFVRFRRAVELLRINPSPTGAEVAIINESNSSVRDPPSSSYAKPPLPPTCPSKGCTGTLSSTLGKRINKQLIKLSGPDFRWIVCCSSCATKWHSCHFLCGHISKISPIGSSDISRHEMGRFNRWQRKIKRPCRNNPNNNILKAGYDEEWRNHKSNGDIEVPEEISRTAEGSVAPSDLTHQTDSNNSKLLRITANEDTFTTASASSFDIDEALFAEPPVCTGTGDGYQLPCEDIAVPTELASGSKRVKLADGSYLREVVPYCPISSMCCEVRKMLLHEEKNTGTV